MRKFFAHALFATLLVSLGCEPEKSAEAEPPRPVFEVSRGNQRCLDTDSDCEILLTEPSAQLSLTNVSGIRVGFAEVFIRAAGATVNLEVLSDPTNNLRHGESIRFELTSQNPDFVTLEAQSFGSIETTANFAVRFDIAPAFEGCNRTSFSGIETCTSRRLENCEEGLGCAIEEHFEWDDSRACYQKTPLCISRVGVDEATDSYMMNGPRSCWYIQGYRRVDGWSVPQNLQACCAPFVDCDDQD